MAQDWAQSVREAALKHGSLVKDLGVLMSQPQKQWKECTPLIQFTFFSQLDVPDVEGSSSGLDGGKCKLRQTMINNLVLNDTRAFRSHPLHLLLHDLAVIDYYFDKGTFNLGQ